MLYFFIFMCYATCMETTYLFENHNLYFRFVDTQKIADVSLMAVGFEKCTSKKAPISGKRNLFVLHYIRSGEGYFEINKKVIKVKGKTLFLIPPDVPVSYYPKTKNPWQYLWIECTGPHCKQLFKQAGFTEDRPTIENIEEIEEPFSQLINTSCENKNGFIYGMIGKFYEIMYTLIKKNSLPVEQDTLNEITEYIKANYFDPNLTIDSIAHKFGISAPYLSKIFKKEKGLSPIKYLLNTRMEHACSMLSTQQYTISEIAYAVGYNSPFYFSNAFKKIYGFPPSSYSTKINFE